MKKRMKNKNLIWWIIGIIVIIILATIFLKYTGRAVESSISTCKDNDGGINHDIQGTIVIRDKIVWEDYCDSDYLYEGYCDGDSIKKESFLCLYGCLMGVCKKCPSKTCSQLGKKCGNFDDGCGNEINCGTCGTGQTCSVIGICVPISKEVDRCPDLSSEVKKTMLSIKKSGVSLSLKEGEKVYSDAKLGHNLFVLDNKQGGVILKVDDIKINTATEGKISLSNYVTSNSVEVVLVNIEGIYKKEGLNIFGASNVKIQVDPGEVYAIVNRLPDNEIDTFVQCS